MDGYDWLGVALVVVLGSGVAWGVWQTGGPRRFLTLLQEVLRRKADNTRRGWDEWRTRNGVPADYTSDRERFGRAWADMLDALGGKRA